MSNMGLPSFDHLKAGRLSAHKLTSGTYAIYPGERRHAFPSAGSSDGVAKHRTIARMADTFYEGPNRLNVGRHWGIIWSVVFGWAVALVLGSVYNWMAGD